LGTPIVATSTGGGMLWQGGFEPFGADWNGAGGAGGFLRFPGAWGGGGGGSIGSGLSHNVHRWYEPGTGRYLKPDPVELGEAMSLFSYAWDNPIKVIDPLGLSPRPLPPSRQMPRQCKPHEIERCRTICEEQGK